MKKKQDSKSSQYTEEMTRALLVLLQVSIQMLVDTQSGMHVDKSHNADGVLGSSREAVKDGSK